MRTIPGATGWNSPNQLLSSFDLPNARRDTGQIHHGLPALWCGLGRRPELDKQRHVPERNRGYRSDRSADSEWNPTSSHTNGVGNCPTGNNQGSPAAGCDFLLTDGLATYRTIVNLLNNGFISSYDSTRFATRMFNASTALAFSYDDARSVACKVNYIKQFGLGGGYVWGLKDDDPN